MTQFLITKDITVVTVLPAIGWSTKYSKAIKSSDYWYKNSYDSSFSRTVEFQNNFQLKVMTQWKKRYSLMRGKTEASLLILYVQE